MTEYEILDLAKQAEYQITSLLQWWVGVSFGLIALAHFGSKRLNTTLVVLGVVLYVGFTGQIILRVLANQQQYFRFFGDLSALQETGVTLSPSTVQLMVSPLPVPWLDLPTSAIAYLGTFLASVGYLVLTYIRERRSRPRLEGRGLPIDDGKPNR